MRSSRAAGLLTLAVLLGCGRNAPPRRNAPAQSATPLRIALFNVEELSRAKLDEVDATGNGTSAQLLAAAHIVLRVHPDVLLLQEIDRPTSPPWEADARLFVERYLLPLDPNADYPYFFAAPTNTGELTGIDLDGDGHVATSEDAGDRAYGNDAFGFGIYPGQYSMAVLSRVPIERDSVRAFQKFLWRDLPGNHLPESFYSSEARSLLRLSSKSHWDLPLRLEDGRRIHLLISHPTPPVFDGDENRNGRRNFDEIRFWALYLSGDTALYDDSGVHGGLTADASFVLMGDLNARPEDNENVFDGHNAISQLLEHPRVRDTADLLRTAGHGDATASFLDGARTDYLLPSRDLEVLGGGVFWPDPEDDPEGAAWAEEASDHHLVWLDVR